MIRHPIDVIPVINVFCQDRNKLYDLLDERFKEIDALDGKSHLNFKWMGKVLVINEGLVGENKGFMFIETILN